jgi:hypothetical protein
VLGAQRSLRSYVRVVTTCYLCRSITLNVFPFRTLLPQDVSIHTVLFPARFDDTVPHSADRGLVRQTEIGEVSAV